jgi:hypothetical protein
MLEQRSGACFTSETSSERWIDREFGVHDFDRDFTRFSILDTPIHRRHSAFAKDASEAKSTC